MDNANLPAMPLPTAYESSGLTKREYLAGLAMQGILTNRQYEAPRRNKINGMAIDAVQAADALLKELE